MQCAKGVVGPSGRLVIPAIILLVAGVSIALQFAISRWQAVTRERVALLGESAPAREGAFHSAMLTGLPSPAARFFHFALTEGQPLITGAVATQDAEFFINNTWRPLTATQHFSTDPVGFVWDARIDMGPMMPVFVRDSYLRGVGAMQASLLGVYTLANQTGTPEMNSGSLQRLLGEALWLPSMLLPGPRVSWSAVDDEVAMATLTDGATTVSLRFHVDPRGAVTLIEGDRYAENDGAYTLRPWRVACGEYRPIDGMKIPGYCEVSWVTEKGVEPYWRGRVTAITYTFAANTDARAASPGAPPSPR